MDRDFIERKLPIALDLWFRDPRQGIHMQPYQREAAIKSLTKFITDDLVNNWEHIQRAEAAKRMGTLIKENYGPLK